MNVLGAQPAQKAPAIREVRARKMRALMGGIAVVALCAVLGSCADKRFNDFDTAGGITKKDYEGLLGRTAPAPQPRGEEPPIPGFQSVLAAPSAPELADVRRVSIAVTETTPVRDILIELARKAQVDLELDPRISGGVIMTATDRPFVEVIERIVDLAELRFKLERNRLRVELDDPYLEQYRMDVLNIQRSASSSSSSSSDASSLASAVGSGSSGGGSNQSATSVQMSTTSNFWTTIGNGIGDIIRGTVSRRGAAANTQAVAANFVPAPAAATPVPPPTAPGGAGGGAGAKPGSAADSLNKAAALGGRQAELDAVIAQDQRPVDEPSLQASDETGTASPGGGGVAQSNYSMNPEAGIITVFATQRQHKHIAKYLRDVRDSLNQQVLIEAKILEVTLSDQYRAGVNWTAVFGPDKPSNQLNVTTNFARSVVPPEFTGPTLAGSWANGCFPVSATCPVPNGDLSIAAQLVKEFGTVRTLSSPRLTVLNNQMAQLKVAQNQVFFQLTVNVTDATTATAAKTTVTSQIKTVPVGLIMSVMPSVDPLTRRISLSLRPSITRITGFVNDPGVAVTIAVAQQSNSGVPNVSSPIPIIEAREMDSLIAMESGQTVVMGGLMQDNSQNTREGLPGVMDIPLLGQVASQNIKQNKVTELIVFIRATLANAPGTVADEDIRIYKTFAPDPRPVAF
jgi:MSHA biogenesis protein MshL